MKELAPLRVKTFAVLLKVTWSTLYRHIANALTTAIYLAGLWDRPDSYLFNWKNTFPLDVTKIALR